MYAKIIFIKATRHKEVKVKLKLSLSISCRSTDEVELHHHSFLSSVLDGGNDVTPTTDNQTTSASNFL
jgi:hypothetical protein